MAAIGVTVPLELAEALSGMIETRSFSSRSVRIWNSSSAPRRSSSLYPNSAIDAGIHRQVTSQITDRTNRPCDSGGCPLGFSREP